MDYSGRPNVITRVLKREELEGEVTTENGQRDAMLLAWKTEGKDGKPRNVTVFGRWKRLLASRKECNPAHTLILAK